MILRNDQWVGYNTDVDGIAYALRDVSVLHKNVLMVDAGGAALAAAYYLKQSNLFWFNRTPDHALPLIERFGGSIVNSEQLAPH